MIAVIGLGFVGLSAALGFAERSGYKVIGYEADEKKRSILKDGELPFFEPHMDEKLRTLLNKKFFLASSMEEAVKGADILFFCVGTPTNEAGEADLNILKAAVGDALKYTATFKVFVVKSTVPPSTCMEELIPFINSHGHVVGKTVGLASNPEFLREGKAWEDFVKPDRIVIGVSDEQSERLLHGVYEPFGAPIHSVSLNTAEFIKYLSNTLLSTMISFSNEMSMAADAIEGINIKDAFRILHEDKRWSGTPANMVSYIYPGCGFGGYCLPKDTEAFYSKSKEKGFEPEILKNVIAVNAKIKMFIVEKIVRGASINSKIGILGLSFKPESDDVRDTPAKYIIEGLLAKGYKRIYAYDPLAMDAFKKNYSYPIEYIATLEDIAETCDILALLTSWKEFAEKKSLFANKVFIDARYFL
jgi:UDPglucose 6-dehydrogenase